MSEAAPIELAPKRLSRVSGARRGVRVGGRWAHLVLALGVVAGVFVQVYLIGAYIFGAGQGALDAHKTAGWTVHGFEMLVFVILILSGFFYIWKKGALDWAETGRSGRK